MWIILLSLFVFAEDVVGEIDCDKEFFEQCQRPKLYDEIPREVEVFKTLCRELSPYIECLRDYDMKCEKEKNRYRKPEIYADTLDMFDELCAEGSILNEIATSNLECFNETFSNTNCKQESDDFLKPYREEVPLDEFTTTHVIPERVSCLSMILQTNCILTDITRKCGIRARYMAVQYVHRSGYVDSFCPLSYRESLLPNIDEFNLTEEQKTFAIAELERMKISDDV
ncbi:hypothetical protein AVEN_244470-1 [Araneus ventricosus]|uniref:DUF19 domain-containing protein n=1 Tax=Araneus ventricosus TaxID=182803 RepID=A0A4Y2L0C6_ARAVE|nr:hypothetical protein AVEN_244470-1 [Araneus ventricosus]